MLCRNKVIVINRPWAISTEYHQLSNDMNKSWIGYELKLKYEIVHVADEYKY